MIHNRLSKDNHFHLIFSLTYSGQINSLLLHKKTETKKKNFLHYMALFPLLPPQKLPSLSCPQIILYFSAIFTSPFLPSLLTAFKEFQSLSPFLEERSPFILYPMSPVPPLLSFIAKMNKNFN